MKPLLPFLIGIASYLCLSDATFSSADEPPEVIEAQHASIDAKHFGPVVHSKEQCTHVGGTWKVYGESPEPRCIVPTTDAGKICTDHSQCQGLCIGPENAVPGTRTSGRCRDTYSVIAACLVRVSDGKAEPKLCVE
jgi:hypothetical protein